MIFKWLHNRQFKQNPECFCGWKMIPAKSPFYETWKCKWKERCGWRVFSAEGGKLHWYQKR